MLDANLTYIFILYKLLATENYIGAAVACSGLIAAGAGIGTVFSIKWSNNNFISPCSLNIKKFTFYNNNNSLKTFLHSSAILNSDPKNPQPNNLENLDSGTNISQPVTFEGYNSSNTRSPILVEVERLENERLSRLQLVRQQQTPQDAEEEDEDPWKIKFPNAESSDDFPWFKDKDGNNISYSKPISLFDGVAIIARYLETRHRINPDQIYEATITELLKLFKENKTITVDELTDHVTKLYKEDNKYFSKKLTTETEKLSEELELVSDSEESKTYKFFGTFGDITLNQLAFNLKELTKDINWELMYEKTKLTIHGAPVAVNAISYALILKSYMKFVHNRPMEKGLNASQLEIRKLGRNRQLGLFCLIGAPLTMLFLRASTIPMKDMFTLSVGGESQVATNNNNSNLINSTLFLSTLLKKKTTKKNNKTNQMLKHRQSYLKQTEYLLPVVKANRA